MIEKMNYKNIREIRLKKNGLINHFPDIEVCVKNLFGIQCQYQMYGFISLFNRVENLTMHEIVCNDNLIKAWGQRTTLHIYHRHEWEKINILYLRRKNWVDKYCRELSIDVKEILYDISNFMSKCKFATKREIESSINNIYKKELMQWGGVLILATLNGILCGCIDEPDKKIYMFNEENEENIELDYHEILCEMIKRYFLFYGPASKKDFSHWSGFSIGEFDGEFKRIKELFDFFILDGVKYYYLKEDKELLEQKDEINIDYPIILGKFDPLLVSYKNKEWILDGMQSDIIWREAGQIEGVIVNRKGVLATWRYKICGNSIIFTVVLTNRITKRERNKLEIKFSQLAKFMGKERYMVSIN